MSEKTFTTEEYLSLSINDLEIHKFTLTVDGKIAVRVVWWTSSWWGWDMYKVENLAWLANYAVARSNLSVYSIAQIDTLFSWYYTEAETDTLLSWKANTSHTHTTSDITNLSNYTWFDIRYYTETEVDTLLSWKANTSHNHSWVYEPVFSKNTAFNKNFGKTVGTVLEWNTNVGIVWTKQVDEAAIWNGKILSYSTTSGKLEYISLGGGGDMLSSTYDPANWARQVAFANQITNFETTTQLNARDTANRSRTNHTWSQTANTISDLNSYTWTLTNKTIDDLTNKIWADHLHFKIKNMTGSTIWPGVLFKAVWYESWDQAIRIAPISSSSDVSIGITKTSIAHWAVSLWVNSWVATWIDTSWLTLNTIYYSNWSWWLTATKPTSWYYQAVAVPLDTKVDWSLLVEFTEPQRVNWNDLYYTETEVDTLLSWKASIIYVDDQIYDSYLNTINESKVYTDDNLLLKADKWSITTSWLTQNTGKLLWRNTTNSWAVEEITLWAWLSFTWTTLNVTASGGWSNPIFTTWIQGQIFTWVIDRFVAKWTQTLAWVKISSASLPTWANISVDIRKNWTAAANSIFTSDTPISITTWQSATNWIYITTWTAIDNWSVVENDVLYIVVTSVGSTLPGSDLEVVVY